MTIKRSFIFELLLDATLLERSLSLITMTNRDDKNFNSKVLKTGVSVINEWPREFTIFVTGTQPVDYLLCGPLYNVVSQSAKGVIESIVGPGIEFLPVKVVEKITGEYFGEYWILNVLNHLDALDWEHTLWITREIPYGVEDAYLNIIKPAFKLKAVENQHMFHLQVGEHIESGIYISALLRENLKLKHATVGMDFMPIKVT